MQIPDRIRRSVKDMKNIRKHIGSNRTIRRFVDNYDMVYFGSIGSKDQADLVRGITISTTSIDKHYCVGTAYGRDVIFVQRNDVFWGGRASEKEYYTWNILAIDLADSVHLPRVFVEGSRRNGVGFRAAAKIRVRDWIDLPPHFMGEYSAKFRRDYIVNIANSSASSFWAMIPPKVADQMVHYFNMFDYELSDDTLFVYYSSKNPSLEKLDHMMKAGVWLADEVEKAFLASTSS